MRLKAFRAVRAARDRAAAVSSVPWDTVSTDEARAIVQANPFSFLRVARPEVDFPPGADPTSAPVYARAAANLREMRRRGDLVAESEACVYVYRLTAGSHRQTGVVACCHSGDYDAGLILRHEHVLPAKVADRAGLIEAVAAHTGPIFIIHRDMPELDAAVAAAVAEGAPLLDFTASDGVAHTVWRVAGGESLLTVLQRAAKLYIADGHHRAAAAAEVAHRRRAALPAGAADTGADWFLAVLFPASQLRIMGYHRLVKDLNGLTPAGFLERLGREVRVLPGGSSLPGRTGRVGLYLAGAWHTLELGSGDLIDASVLQDRVLGPILGIADPTRDPRIGFVGGVRPSSELTGAVDAGRAAAAFVMHPVGVEQMLAVCDAGGIMPPKSTWFEPKLRSGLFVHMLDD